MAAQGTTQIGGSNGIPPIIRRNQEKTKQALNRTVSQIDRAQRQGAAAIRAILSNSVVNGGVGSRLNVSG